MLQLTSRVGLIVTKRALVVTLNRKVCFNTIQYNLIYILYVDTDCVSIYNNEVKEIEHLIIFFKQN